MAESKALFGRNVIYTDEWDITSDNVVEVLKKALEVHDKNSKDINYLYQYYKGKQPVLDRQKEVRPEINNKIVENRANEIVAFKVGYLMGEPVQYVSRTNEESYAEGLKLLNEYVFAEDKASKDKELAEWFTICGTAYRMILPDDEGVEDDESPFEIYTLDPRFSFVVYHSGLGNKPVMGVKYIKRSDDKKVYSIYTREKYYELLDETITSVLDNPLGAVPIIEYPLNSARLGAFEVVLPLLDAINEVASNRLDGVEQFIQALMMFKGVDIDSEDFSRLRELGGIKVPSEGDVKYLTQELNQGATQTLVDNLYNTVLTICGMPNRNGGSSTSDTGSAVILRDGWYSAEARAKDTELMFKKAEKEFLRLALFISNLQSGFDLKLSAVDIRFTRRNYENIQEKAQVLTTMLANSKIHPRLAFEHSGMFIDPELAYQISRAYTEEEERSQLEESEQFEQEEALSEKEELANVDVSDNGQDTTKPED